MKISWCDPTPFPYGLAVAMKHYLCVITSIVLASCVVIPVPVEQTAVDGTRFAESDLDFVSAGKTSRTEVTGKLGNPTLWLSAQQILVYGLRRADTGAIWFIGAGVSGVGGLVTGETREAVYLVFDEKNIVTNWGRAPVKRCETWLSAAIDWADSKSIAIPRARDRFVEQTPTVERSFVYFYRSRDYQHYLPLVPPASKIAPGVANYVDISQDGQLLGQLQWQSYVVIQVPPGTHRFVVNPDTDCVENPEIYRSAMIQLDVAPETITFVDVGVKAGLGTIEPVLINRPRSEAIPVIEKLGESW